MIQYKWKFGRSCHSLSEICLFFPMNLEFHIFILLWVCKNQNLLIRNLIYFVTFIWTLTRLIAFMTCTSKSWNMTGKCVCPDLGTDVLMDWWHRLCALGWRVDIYHSEFSQPPYVRFFLRPSVGQDRTPYLWDPNLTSFFLSCGFFFFFLNIYLFICLHWVPAVACRTLDLCCGIQNPFNSGMWNL